MNHEGFLLSDGETGNNLLMILLHFFKTWKEKLFGFQKSNRAYEYGEQMNVKKMVPFLSQCLWVGSRKREQEGAKHFPFQHSVLYAVTDGLSKESKPI